MVGFEICRNLQNVNICDDVNIKQRQFCPWFCIIRCGTLCGLLKYVFKCTSYAKYLPESLCVISVNLCACVTMFFFLSLHMYSSHPNLQWMLNSVHVHPKSTSSLSLFLSITFKTMVHERVELKQPHFQTVSIKPIQNIRPNPKSFENQLNSLSA